MLKLRESFDNDQYLRGIRREYQYDEDISWRHVVDNMSLSDGESPGRGHMRQPHENKQVGIWVDLACQIFAQVLNARHCGVPFPRLI